MKKCIVLILSVCMLTLSACQADHPPAIGADISGPDLPGEAVFRGTVAGLVADSLLLIGDQERAGDLYLLSSEDLELEGIKPGGFAPGMTVEVVYGGFIMETYPGQLYQPQKLTVTGQTDDLPGLYLQVIRDLYEEDPGLNSGISVLALDMSQAENLTPAQKSAVTYLAELEYQVSTIQSDYRQLEEEGLIAGMQFETGMLIRFYDMDFAQNAFTFTVEKWRSSLGACFFIDCQAESTEGGVWSYQVGQHAIS